MAMGAGAGACIGAHVTRWRGGGKGRDWHQRLRVGRAALIAWLPVVRVDELVKDGAISAVTRVFDALRRRRLRRSTIFDQLIHANKTLSMRSRPLSRPCHMSWMQICEVRHMAERCGRWHNTAPEGFPMSFRP